VFCKRVKSKKGQKVDRKVKLFTELFAGGGGPGRLDGISTA